MTDTLHCEQCGAEIQLGFAQTTGHKPDCEDASYGDMMEDKPELTQLFY